MLGDFHPEALVIWISPGKVAVGKQFRSCVVAIEFELLIIAHDDRMS